MTTTERIQALMGLGYTEREAEFLCIASLHGGFFLRRQYSQFTGTASGGADTVLIDKLLARGHGGALLGCQKAVVYHISTRPFYNAIGQENNRNRRMRSTVAIKNRLMGLDYVLDTHGDFLATEEEKVAFFNGTEGIELAELPQKVFRSPTGEQTTSRYFPDKYPIYLQQGPGGPVVCFSYIDEGSTTLSRFDAYLTQYRGVFMRLPSFILGYVAASRNLLWEAERRFNRFISGAPAGDLANPANLDLVRLMAYFRDRQDYEAGPGPSFDRARLIRFRDDRLEFTGAFFDSLFNEWKLGGEAAVQATLTAKKSLAKPLSGGFEVRLLKHNYDLFGAITNPNNSAHWAEEA